VVPIFAMIKSCSRSDSRTQQESFIAITRTDPAAWNYSQNVDGILFKAPY